LAVLYPLVEPILILTKDPLDTMDAGMFGLSMNCL